MAASVRSIFRAANPLRNAAFKVSTGGKASLARPPLRLPKSTAVTSPRSLRSPLEMSFGVESLLPMHSATASALMTSLIAVSRPGYGWMTEGVFLFQKISFFSIFFAMPICLPIAL